MKTLVQSSKHLSQTVSRPPLEEEDKIEIKVEIWQIRACLLELYWKLLENNVMLSLSIVFPNYYRDTKSFLS